MPWLCIADPLDSGRWTPDRVEDFHKERILGYFDFEEPMHTSEFRSHVSVMRPTHGITGVLLVLARCIYTMCASYLAKTFSSCLPIYLFHSNSENFW
jgi:hypothetical protein